MSAVHKDAVIWRALLVVAVCLAVPRSSAARGTGGPMLDVGHPLLLDVGHTKRVTSLALSPDGTQLASASEDGTVRLFDAQSGHLRAELHVAGEVFDVVFSPDGSRLATGSTYNLVKLWDARTAEHLATFEDGRMWVTSVAFSPDGGFLASCDMNGGIVVRDLNRGTIRRVTLLNARRVGWRPDGRALVVVAGDRFSILDASAWEPSPDGGSPTSLAGVASVTVGRSSAVAWSWNSSGGQLAFGERELRVTDFAGSGQRRSPHKPSALAFSPDGRRLAIGGRDGTVEIRDAGLEKTIFRVATGKGAVTSLLWSHDGGRVYAGNEHGAILAWSLATGQRIADVPAQVLGVHAVAWGPHDRLATPDALWDMTTGRIVAKLEPPAWSVSWCGDVLVSLGPKEIAWRDGTTGAVLATAAALPRASSVVCAPDGRKALVYGYGLEVWDTAEHTGQKLGDDWLASAAWGPDGRIALGFEHALEIWRLTKRGPLRERRRGDGARVLAWRADGLIAADIGAFHRIDAYWVETGLSALRAGSLAASGRWLTSCVPDSLDKCDWDAAAWSPDGSRLATIVDRVLSIVDVPPRPKRRGAAPARIPDHAGTAGVSWSLDGRVLAAADAFGVVLIRLNDGATLRLREIRVDDRILGLVEDGHGRFGGDEALTIRVVPDAPRGSGGPLHEVPSRQPDLLERFLAGAGH